MWNFIADCPFHAFNLAYIRKIETVHWWVGRAPFISMYSVNAISLAFKVPMISNCEGLAID